MPEETITEEKPEKIKDGFIIYAAMRRQGHSQEKAAVLAGYKPGSHAYLEKQLSKITIKGDLSLQKAAQRNLKKIVNGKAFGTVEKISPGAALEAIKMVKEQVEPVIKKTVNVNVSVEATPIDLEVYRAKPANDPQDVGASSEAIDVENLPPKEPMESIG